MASNSSPHHSGNSSLKFPTDVKTMIIPPKALNIVWGNDNRYWTVPEKEGLPTPAELHQVSWLEVTGVVDDTNPNKNCEVGFCVSLNPDAFGWGKYPIYMMIKKGAKISWTKININPNQKGEFEIKGRWMKADQQSQNNVNSSDRKVFFGLYEVWSGKWKGGLKIHSVYVKELP